jgi:hypothetical protein
VSTQGELNKLTQACVPFKLPGKLNELPPIEEQIRFEIEDFLARHQHAIADPDRVRLEYCLLQHYAANDYSDHVRASLKLFDTPRYSGQLEPNQKYALGYWTLDLNRQGLGPELATAENWLASALREWKETTEDEARGGDAFWELLRRDERLQRWYMEMLHRLGELRPKNFEIASALGETLARGRDAADADRALMWLERARRQITAVPEADRPRRIAWLEYAAANSFLTKARVRAGKTNEDAAEEATSRLEALIQNLKKRGVISDSDWPGASAYSTLIDTYQFRDKIDTAARTLDASREDGLSEETAELLGSRVSLLLVAGRTNEALQLAKSARENPNFDRSGALFLAALAQLVTIQPEAEDAAREFLLTTNHEYRDYIRLMLYWYLARNGRVDRAKAYLDERWRDINPASWPARLAHGDQQVWRERLIGYYIGKVRPDDIFAPLRSEEAFKSSGLSHIDMSYDEIRCEAHFYDALLQAVTGDPATRSARFAQAIQRVLEVGHGDIYEYLMALYLRSGG